MTLCLTWPVLLFRSRIFYHCPWNWVLVWFFFLAICFFIISLNCFLHNPHEHQNAFEPCNRLNDFQSVAYRSLGFPACKILILYVWFLCFFFSFWGSPWLSLNMWWRRSLLCIATQLPLLFKCQKFYLYFLILLNFRIINAWFFKSIYIYI